jgi:hypothetical protein
MAEMKDAHTISVGTPEDKRPFGKPKHRWKDVKVSLKEIGCSGVDWIQLAHDTVQWRAFVSTVMNLQVSLKERNVLTR